MNYRDVLGFAWHMCKVFAKPFGFVMYLISCAGMNFAPKPYDTLCFLFMIVCFISWFWPLTRDLFSEEYKRYRAKKEEAWNILKETK
jgi:hypothetical protein